MVRRTMLAEHIDTAGEKARLDGACKKLLADKSILAWILKGTLEEYRECDVQKIAEQYIEGAPDIAKLAVHRDEKNICNRIRGENTEDSTMTEGGVTFDIRFRAVAPQNGEFITLLLNVEAQNDCFPGYPLVKRGIYYCCRMVSGQYGTEFQNSHYEDIKKVYSIWICINPPGRKQNTITKYEITEKNMAGRVREEAKNYDLLSAVIICLGSPDREAEDKGVIALLSTLLSEELNAEDKKKILEQDFAIAMTEKIDKEVNEMCNYSKGIEERGIAKGMAQGMAQGMELIRHLIKDGRCSEIERVVSDTEYQNQLLKEYGF